MNVAEICVQSFPPATIPRTAHLEAVNVNLSVHVMLFSSNQLYPFYPQPTHLTPVDPICKRVFNGQQFQNCAKTWGAFTFASLFTELSFLMLGTGWKNFIDKQESFLPHSQISIELDTPFQDSERFHTPILIYIT